MDGDTAAVVKKLRDDALRTRKEFLAIDIGVCRTALEMAEFEFSVGNTDLARNELQSARKGASVIEELLGGVPPAQRGGLETEIAALKKMALRMEELLANS